MTLKSNPFVETKEIADGVWHMRSPGWSPSYMYLVEGSRRALLIDTGFGIGDLKGAVEELTRLPYDVVNTHCHGDHALGNYQFSRVHIHRADLRACRDNDLPEARLRFTTPPPNMAMPFSPAEFVPVAPYDLVPIDAGYVFDLGGGFALETIGTPGHTLGGVCLLDGKRRMLFSGDSLVHTPTFIFSLPGARPPWGTVEDYREAMISLNGRTDEFDGMYAGHSELDLPPSMVVEMIACCEEIMAGDSLGQVFSFLGAEARIHAHGRASIAYSRDRIFRSGG